MDDTVKQALQKDRIIDITTTGRKTGQARRIEIMFHNLDGRIFITGLPGSRSWYANLLDNPDFIFHLKHSVQVDSPAHARPILDATERRAVLSRIVTNLDRNQELDEWVTRSPLVEVTF